MTALLINVKFRDPGKAPETFPALMAAVEAGRSGVTLQAGGKKTHFASDELRSVTIAFVASDPQQGEYGAGGAA